MHGLTIGIIGGTGWLGRSIATALVQTEWLDPAALILSSRSGSLSEPGILSGVRITADNQDLVRQSDMVILSVRPEDLAAVRIDMQDRLLISLVAGVCMSDLQNHVGSQRVIRAMPNAALETLQSYTPWLASERVQAADKALVQQLFETCGQADEVHSERELDYLTGLTGTGPSYPALLAKAMYNCAIAQGIAEPIARRAVAAVVVQASQLITPQRDFEALLQTLLDYKGVSAAGINGMLAGGLEASVKSGLDAAMGVAQSSLWDGPDRNK
jgi:pyrroline-5-carboxylate reductase